MRSISGVRHFILPKLIRLIREHGADWGKARCECCQEKPVKDAWGKEGVIGTPVGCFCADCIEEFLEFVLGCE